MKYLARFVRTNFMSIVSQILVLTFTTNVVFASKPEENFWRARATEKPIQVASLPSPLSPFSSTRNNLLQNELLKQTPQIQSALEKVVNNSLKQSGFAQSTNNNLPLSFLSHVNVRETFKGETKAPVILLQDIHLNQEAQSHLSNAIRALGNTEGTKTITVGLEGAEGPTLYDTWKAFSDKNVSTQIANSFFEHNDISGPAHAGFTSYTKEGFKGLHFIGVDSLDLHTANVKAYRDSKALKSDVQKTLSELKTKNTETKEKTFPPSLLNFDKQVQSYRAGKLSLAAFLKILSSLNNDVSINVETFIQASNMEKSFDFAQVEMERTRVLEKLVQSLKEKDLNELVQLSAAYKEGLITFAGYYGHLKNICSSHKINLRATPQFDSYIQYVLLTDGIKTEELFKEISALEKETYAKLSITNEQKELIAEDRQLYLTAQLVEFSMTSEQWKEYKDGKPLLSSPLKKRGEESALRNALVPFESFYQLADERSEVMARNILAANQNDNPSILVAGGFHTEGLTERFKAKNISYVVASPKLTKVEGLDGTHYLSVFDREKTSLEKIFTGQKLFLVDNPAGTSSANALTKTARMAEAQLATRSALGETLTTAEENYLRVLGFSAGFSWKNKATAYLQTLSSNGLSRTYALKSNDSVPLLSRLRWKKAGQETMGDIRLEHYVQRSAFNIPLAIWARVDEKFSKKPKTPLDEESRDRKSKPKNGKWKPWKNLEIPNPTVDNHGWKFATGITLILGAQYVVAHSDSLLFLGIRILSFGIVASPEQFMAFLIITLVPSAGFYIFNLINEKKDLQRDGDNHYSFWIPFFLILSLGGLAASGHLNIDTTLIGMMIGSLKFTDENPLPVDPEAQLLLQQLQANPLQTRFKYIFYDREDSGVIQHTIDAVTFISDEDYRNTQKLLLRKQSQHRDQGTFAENGIQLSWKTDGDVLARKSPTKANWTIGLIPQYRNNSPAETKAAILKTLTQVAEKNYLGTLVNEKSANFPQEKQQINNRSKKLAGEINLPLLITITILGLTSIPFLSKANLSAISGVSMIEWSIFIVVFAVIAHQLFFSKIYSKPSYLKSSKVNSLTNKTVSFDRGLFLGRQTEVLKLIAQDSPHTPSIGINELNSFSVETAKKTGATSLSTIPQKVVRRRIVAWMLGLSLFGHALIGATSTEAAFRESIVGKENKPVLIMINNAEEAAAINKVLSEQTQSENVVIGSTLNDDATNAALLASASKAGSSFIIVNENYRDKETSQVIGPLVLNEAMEKTTNEKVKALIKNSLQTQSPAAIDLVTSRPDDIITTGLLIANLISNLIGDWKLLNGTVVNTIIEAGILAGKQA